MTGAITSDSVGERTLRANQLTSPPSVNQLLSGCIPYPSCPELSSSPTFPIEGRGPRSCQEGSLVTMCGSVRALLTVCGSSKHVEDKGGRNIAERLAICRRKLCVSGTAVVAAACTPVARGGVGVEQTNPFQNECTVLASILSKGVGNY